MYREKGVEPASSPKSDGALEDHPALGGGHFCVFQFCFDALDFSLWSKRERFLQGRSFFLETEKRNEVL